MKIIYDISEYKSAVKNSKNIGFIPTMGTLHKGHISLVEKSLKENNITVCSIFINEIQFNNKEDYSNYPRTKDKDIKMLEEAGCDILFYPKKEDIYTKNFNNYKIDMSVLNNIEKEMEGKFRTGHFEGVVKIVTRFFEIIKPTNSYFGEKDFQQYLIIASFCKVNNIPVNVIPCETFREKNGLAMSSRNLRLTDEERQNASIIYKSLCEIKEKFDSKTISELKNIFVDNISKYPNLKLEYLEVADKNTLKVAKTKDKENQRIFTSVFVKGIRLIDNISLKE